MHEANVTQLGEVLESIVGGGTPSRKNEGFYEGNIPWVTVKDLVHHHLDKAQEYITEEAVMKSATNLIPKGTVIIATRMALGKAFINLVDVAINQDLKALIPNKDLIDSEFLLHTIIGNASAIQSMGSGTTVMGIRLEQLKSLSIFVPKLYEQHKIANMLNSVDSAISKTDAIIEQTEKVKKGLMQQLLTKGIGHTKFKQTEIGEIPETWEVNAFGQIFSLIKSGISRRLVPDDVGYPVIRSSNIGNAQLILDDLKYWYFEDDQGVDLKNLILEDGDILVNFINSLAQIGKCCLFTKQDRDFIYTTNIFRMRVKPDVLLNRYFHYYSQTTRYETDLQSIVKPAVNQASFTKSDFENLQIGLPPVSEQNKIVEILTSLDDKLTSENLKLNQLLTLKKGLMQVLLTGKVRVKVDDPEVVST
ncbi:type I restriction enzyme, S subunit [Paenibacillus sp. CF384]|nr:type I restriction enzyme, S subunit [Paenibacillus sp. CF384]